MNRISVACSFVAYLFLGACANQTSPTGGPKDETPPILLSSTPEQGQIHYDGKQIILTFDELIRTDNPKEQFIITPRIKDEYEIKFRKNKVIIEFEKALEDSTTYSINFREGIKDITEGNPADTLRLAFSTGSYLDSLSLTGSVKDLLSNKQLEDVTVTLYKANDTLNILNSPPLYLTKTTKDGKYSLRNVKNGKYRIYAIVDKNKNMMLESKSEAHGFLSPTLSLDSNLSTLNISTQLLDVREMELQSARQTGTTYNIKFNKYITDYHARALDTTYTIYSNYADENHNTIQIFEPTNLKDSTAVTISATDSVHSALRDTIMIKFEPTQRSPGEFTTATAIKKIVTNIPVFNATLTFSKPITRVNFDSLFVYLDSTNIITFNQDQLHWNNQKDILILTAKIDPKLFIKDEKPAPKPEEIPPPLLTEQQDTIPEEKKVTPPKPHFYAGPSTFISAENDSSKVIEQGLTFMRPEQLSIIIVEVQTSEEHFFVQLVNTRNEVVAEQADTHKFKFRNIEPGEYKIRVLVDSNGNGKWDPGNINYNQEPEPVVFYQATDGTEIITPRANWELGPNILKF